MFTGLTSLTHLIILLVIILLLFGAKRLPELGWSLGQGIKKFREGLNADRCSLISKLNSRFP
jgi:sec-independent protein translocase protein TatA